ncbi:hypothetical protein [Acaryochloris sp. IP29b_bin.137]|uniref:hypothetical protein n=1 Tax=Acaryochloris sp. IP29b_bin.137 TaxID=2969217 RepID=UPI002614C16A|nr:hypothetical protein [Acaryochloris sp. IP29b_bin.137]
MSNDSPDRWTAVNTPAELRLSQRQSRERVSIVNIVFTQQCRVERWISGGSLLSMRFDSDNQTDAVLKPHPESKPSTLCSVNTPSSSGWDNQV